MKKETLALIGNVLLVAGLAALIVFERQHPQGGVLLLQQILG